VSAEVDVGHPDPRILQVVTKLETLNLVLVQRRHFADEAVYMDGREFKDCEFRGCRLLVKTGRFRITGNVHMSECTFEIDGPARGVQSIFELLARQPS